MANIMQLDDSDFKLNCYKRASFIYRHMDTFLLHPQNLAAAWRFVMQWPDLPLISDFKIFRLPLIPAVYRHWLFVKHMIGDRYRLGKFVIRESVLKTSAYQGAAYLVCAQQTRAADNDQR